jgi:hypothetical protein
MHAETPAPSNFGRALMTLSAVMYGVVPLVVDLTQTHILNPDWPPHARLHMAWLLGSHGAIAALAIYLIWFAARNVRNAIHLAGALSVCVLGGFFVSAATMKMYGGSLTDPGGVPPFHGVDGNLIAFSVALLLSLAGWALAVRRS